MSVQRSSVQRLCTLVVAFGLATGLVWLLQADTAYAETAGVMYVISQANVPGGGGTIGLVRVNPTRPNGGNQTLVSSGQNFAYPK